MIQKLYDRYVCPHLIDWVCSGTPFPKQRELVIPKARGRVLEIGLGSGLNLEYYDQGAVSELHAVEPDSILLEKARTRASAQGIDLSIKTLSAERLPFENDYFDTVVSTFTLCSIENLSAVLSEISRVLKKDGKFLFCEHGKAPDEGLERWQRRLNPIQKRLGGGCMLDKDIPRLILDAGFRIEGLEEQYLPGIKLLSYQYWGEAIPGQ